MVKKKYSLASACIGPVALLFLSCPSLPPPSPQKEAIEVPFDIPQRAEPLRVEEAPPELTVVERVLAAMTVREKIAQHFIVWIPRNADEGRIEELKTLGTAGYILYPWNYTSLADARSLSTRLDRVAPIAQGAYRIRPFICADQEGGRVAAFRFREFPAQPSAFLLGSLGDDAVVEAAAYATAAKLTHLGVNMNLAPVADLYHLGDRTIIGDRSFGPDPASTAAAVAAYVRGLQRGGIIATVKHFPGHGVTTVDSHGRLPVVDTDAAALRSREMIPFAAGIRAGAPVVMTAHILYRSIDPENPATLSPIILGDLLRGELGFKGIILTDGFEMGALSQTFSRGESLARALEAGVNLVLLYHNYDPVEMMDLMEGLLREGRITTDLIDRNVRHILEVKEAYGLLVPNP